MELADRFGRFGRGERLDRVLGFDNGGRSGMGMGDVSG